MTSAAVTSSGCRAGRHQGFDGRSGDRRPPLRRRPGGRRAARAGRGRRPPAPVRRNDHRASSQVRARASLLTGMAPWLAPARRSPRTSRGLRPSAVGVIVFYDVGGQFVPAEWLAPARRPVLTSGHSPMTIGGVTVRPASTSSGTPGPDPVAIGERRLGTAADASTCSGSTLGIDVRLRHPRGAHDHGIADSPRSRRPARTAVPGSSVGDQRIEPSTSTSTLAPCSTRTDAVDGAKTTGRSGHGQRLGTATWRGPADGSRVPGGPRGHPHAWSTRRHRSTAGASTIVQTATAHPARPRRQPLRATRWADPASRHRMSSCGITSFGNDATPVDRGTDGARRRAIPTAAFDSASIVGSR